MSEPSEAFWQFSLTVYVRPGASDACLGLQDRLGLDVNILLFCCWAGSQGHALSAEETESLRATAGPWHDEVVRPLRAARRWLKGRETLAAGAAGALRVDIKAKELEAERIEQHLLAEALPFDAGAPDPAVVADNLLTYVATLGRPLGEADREDLAVLLAATLPSLTLQEARRRLCEGL